MLILFHGGDAYTSWQNLQNEIKKSGKTPLIVFGQDIKSFNEIVAGTENFSFFTTESEKVIVVKRLSESKSKTIVKELIEKIEKGYKSDIYLWEDHKLDKYSSLLKAISKIGKINETRTPGLIGMKKFASEFFKSEGIGISEAVLNVLVAKMPSDKVSMANELDKLLMLLHGNKKTSLELEDLEAISFNEIENQVWDLTDAMTRRDKKEALKLVNKLFKRNEDFPLIISALTNQLELLYMLKENISTSEMLEKFKIHPFIIEKNKINAVKFTKDQLKVLFQKATNLDFSVKQGRIDARLGLNLLITTL